MNAPRPSLPSCPVCGLSVGSLKTHDCPGLHFDPPVPEHSNFPRRDAT